MPTAPFEPPSRPGWLELPESGSFPAVPTTTISIVTTPMIASNEPGVHGAVDDDFKIGMHEVANAQYVPFLNAVAADGPNRWLS